MDISKSPKRMDEVIQYYQNRIDEMKSELSKRLQLKTAIRKIGKGKPWWGPKSKAYMSKPFKAQLLKMNLKAEKKKKKTREVREARYQRWKKAKSRR